MEVLSDPKSLGEKAKNDNITDFLYSWYLDDQALLTVEEVGQPKWSHIADQLVAGLVVTGSFIFLSWILERTIAKRGRKFTQLVNEQLGFTGLPSRIWVRSMLYYVEVMVTTITIVSWVIKTYHFSTGSTRQLDLVLGIYCAAFYIIQWIISGFSVDYTTRWWSILDSLTFVPMIAQSVMTSGSWGGPGSWINFSYMRIFQLYKAWNILKANNDQLFQHMSVPTKEMIDVGVRALVMILFFAGTIFVLEVLGDLTWMSDAMITKDGVEISFYQMCYYTLVTISTVGYGDYAPHTVMGRMFAVVIIAGGVGLFSVLLGDIMDLQQRQTSGLGWYKKKKTWKQHIIVAGGAVNEFNLEVLTAFVHQCVKPTEYAEAVIPDIVLMGTARLSEGQLPFLEDENIAERCSYSCGSVSDESDLARVYFSTCTAVYILPDTDLDDEEKEDENNILMALTLGKRLGIGQNLNVMLLNPISFSVGIQMGLPAESLTVFDDVTHLMNSKNSTCHGFPTLVYNMLSSPTVEEHNEAQSVLESCPKEECWINDYWAGRKQCLRVAILGSRYDGIPTTKLQTILYRDFNGLVLVGAIIKNEPMLMPLNCNLEIGDRVFILGPYSGVSAFQKSQSDIESEVLEDRSYPLEPPSNESHYAFCDTLLEIVANASADSHLKEHTRVKDSKEDGTHGKDQKSAQRRIMPGTAYHVEDEGHKSHSSELARSRSLPKLQLSKKSHSALSIFGAVSPALSLDRSVCMDEVLNLRGHIVILTDTTAFESKGLVTLFLQLNQQMLSPQTIVVVSPGTAPVWLSERFPKVMFLEGRPRNRRTWAYLCVKSAASVIILGSTVSEALLYGRNGMDNTTLVTRSVLEDFLKAIKRFHCRPHIVLELFHVRSLSNLHLHFAEDRRTKIKLEAGEMPSDHLKTNSGYSEHISGQVNEQTFHESIAAGEIWTKCALARMYAHDYYERGAINLLNSLVYAGFGTKENSSEITERDCTIISVRIPTRWLKFRYGDLYLKIHQTGAVLLGLYRPTSVGGSRLPFVVTNPPPDTELVMGDKAYVLIHRSWTLQHYIMLVPQTMMSAIIIQRTFRRFLERKTTGKASMRPSTSSPSLGRNVGDCKSSKWPELGKLVSTSKAANSASPALPAHTEEQPPHAPPLLKNIPQGFHRSSIPMQSGRGSSIRTEEQSRRASGHHPDPVDQHLDEERLSPLPLEHAEVPNSPQADSHQLSSKQKVLPPVEVSDSEAESVARVANVVPNGIHEAAPPRKLSPTKRAWAPVRPAPPSDSEMESASSPLQAPEPTPVKAPLPKPYVMPARYEHSAMQSPGLAKPPFTKLPPKPARGTAQKSRKAARSPTDTERSSPEPERGRQRLRHQNLGKFAKTPMLVSETPDSLTTRSLSPSDLDRTERSALLQEMVRPVSWHRSKSPEQLRGKRSWVKEKKGCSAKEFKQQIQGQL